ncbi:hypothetical protein VOLCADRAFT_86189 [Volvox carteri f. nagariensis]|uniref:Uncharacterized protein n=1 Tax=Volvox carteri f. nagariensis TaxID=3068 RepID=D8TI44_VOLCA|nr:uncharacterized protein VOLCADRAFT_86189 [Volvox carteri f. nagariensis]EFJ52828.1 hypothetical protein VOLCADRAFT_86189 [Volvox carteri f. nagariensis]|eukprot:XP_002945833.1 hypothetical protein VOLCADRAFT_86189 [Volvox carteri f. nagariensis]
MSGSDIRNSNPVLARLEQEAVRAAIPKGLKDERSRQLEYELNWCYNRNNWYFTGGGLVLGLTLGYTLRSVQPLAWAAILAPAGDWLYEQHACRGLQESFNEHQRQLKREAREAADRARAEVRQLYGLMLAEGSSPEAAAAAVAEVNAANSAAAAAATAAARMDGAAAAEDGGGGSSVEMAAAAAAAAGATGRGGGASNGALEDAEGGWKSAAAAAPAAAAGGGGVGGRRWWWPWGGGPVRGAAKS